VTSRIKLVPWPYARIRSDIVNEVQRVRFFVILRPTDSAEVIEALNRVVSVKRCTIELDNCWAIADLLHASFTDFARRCPTAPGS
jgi:hypothetical protein